MRYLYLLIVLCLCRVGIADDVYLKNGLILNGTAVKVPGLNTAVAAQNNSGNVAANPYWLIDDGVRRYFVYYRQVAQFEDIEELASKVYFDIEHEKSARTSGFANVGLFTSIQPFNEFGRRTVSLVTHRGNTPIIQGITRIRPDYTQVESLSHSWEYNIDTKSIPDETLTQLLKHASNPDSLVDQKGIVLFYIQASMYKQAEQELERLAAKHPDLADWCDEYERQIVELKALQALNEVERRQLAGQHGLAFLIASKFPQERVSAEVFRKAKEIADGYQRALEDRERAIMLLDLLQAKLPVETADKIRPIQAKLIDEMHYETIHRLDAFLNAEFDNQLQADQKLSLAYTGWLFGSEQATLDLDEAIRLWEARFLILDFLRTNEEPLRDEEVFTRLEELEGVSVSRIAEMVPNLPMAFESGDLPAGVVGEVHVTTDVDDPDVKYSIMLPPEYSPNHRYPLLMVLKGEFQTFDNAVRWWGGDDVNPGWAQRRGYIVIAPHYCSAEQTEHDYSDDSHKIVMKSLEHVRKRFRVDSDRVFLAGHGMGGDACFDIAMAHPGEFAGAIPIVGMIDKHATFLSANPPLSPWYVVAGERDRGSLDHNAGVLNRMIRKGHDVIYCEYKGRGFEPYQEEQERIFNWMNANRRVRLSDVKEFEVGGLRRFNNQFLWMEGKALPDSLYQAIRWDVPSRKILRKFEGKITPGGTIYVDHPGRVTTVWLSPELVNFDERVNVRVNRRSVFNDFIAPSLNDFLTDLRRRGDRERCYWLRLDLGI